MYDILSKHAVIIFQVIIAERRNILSPVPQRRDHKLHDIDPIEKVFSEFPLLYGVFQIPVCRRDHPGVHLDVLQTTDTLKFLMIQKCEDLCLHGEGKLPDLI